VSTLVVCGGLPLLMNAVASAGETPAAAFPSVCTLAAEGAPQPVWSNGLLLDSPDDSDDDGDDDAPGGDAAIVVAVHHHTDGGLLEEVVDLPVHSWISHSQDRPTLRGPPSLTDDDGSLSDNDDDDEDDDDSDQLKAFCAAASVSDDGCRTHALAIRTPARASSSPTRGYSLRAPPARTV